MATCGTYLDSEDIFRLIARTDGTNLYLNIIDNDVTGDALDCEDTLLEDDILNLILAVDGNGNYGLNCIVN
jgi:hypothetical protein